jgi:hypothetical protein
MNIRGGEASGTSTSFDFTSFPLQLLSGCPFLDISRRRARLFWAPPYPEDVDGLRIGTTDVARRRI